jgi:UrcA family protein
MNTRITIATRSLTVYLAVTLAFGAVAASAGDLSTDPGAGLVQRKYVVRFAELDLSKIAGVATLYSRIRNAAHIVCEPGEDAWSPSLSPDRPCIAKAIAAAVAKINRPLLTQYHQLRIQEDSAGLLQLAKAH